MFGLGHFWMGIQFVWGDWLRFPHEFVLRFCPNIVGSLVGLSFVPWFPFKKEIWIYWRYCDCYALQSNRSGLLVDLSYITVFLRLYYTSALMLGFITAVLSSSDEKVSRNWPDLVLTFLHLTDFLAVVFPIILSSRGGKDKDNKKKVRIDLSFLVTFSPFHFVALQSSVCSISWAWDRC